MNYKDPKNKPNLLQFKDNVLQRLDAIITLGTEDPHSTNYKKSALLAYWLDDFTNFLTWESDFSPRKLKRYERGDIIKVNLGFNVGNEQGGLHYAVVLDKNNALNSGTLTIIPLSSKKKGKPVHPMDVDLGNDIYGKIKLKLSQVEKSVEQRIDEATKLLDMLQNVHLSDNVNKDDYSDISNRCKTNILKAKKELETVHKIKRETERMKSGSIGIVSQITTISKMRIYDPRNTGGVLSGIKLSPCNLDLINNKITEFFLS